MVIQMTCVQPNCHSAIYTQTQMQTETEGYRMHKCQHSQLCVLWENSIVAISCYANKFNPGIEWEGKRRFIMLKILLYPEAIALLAIIGKQV